MKLHFTFLLSYSEACLCIGKCHLSALMIVIAGAIDFHMDIAVLFQVRAPFGK